MSSTQAAQGGAIQTLRELPLTLEGFEILSEYYQKSGLELRGVVSSTSGSGSGSSSMGVGNSSMSISSSISAYYIGALKQFPAVPSLGSFKGKLLLRKEEQSSAGVLASSKIYELDRDGSIRNYAEVEVEVSLLNGACEAKFTWGGKVFSRKCSYVRKGDAVILFNDGLTVRNSLLCGTFNPTIDSTLAVSGSGLNVRMYQYNPFGDDFDKTFSLAKVGS